MTIKAELGYIEYASLCNIGRQLCELPEDIQDEIEEFMDGIDVTEDTKCHPDEVVANYLQRFSRRDVIVQEMGEREATDEEIAEWDEDEIIQTLLDKYTYLGEEDGIYYVM